MWDENGNWLPVQSMQADWTGGGYGGWNGGMMGYGDPDPVWYPGYPGYHHMYHKVPYFKYPRRRRRHRRHQKYGKWDY